MRKLWVYGLGFALLFGSVGSDVYAFSLQSPITRNTTEKEWNKTVDRIEGIPFKHRTYGDIDAVVMRVVDGDTLYVRIANVHPIVGYEIGIRVYGIDTRELNDGGNKSKEFAKTFLKPGDKVVLKNLRRGKYFRIVADVIVNGESLAEILLEKGLAYPYYGGKKRPIGWKPKDYEYDDE
jgi:endonuclease YncB( thermonuclease family)